MKNSVLWRISNFRELKKDLLAMSIFLNYIIFSSNRVEGVKDSYLMPVLRALLCLMNGDPEFPEANPFHPILVDISVKLAEKYCISCQYKA